MSATEGLFGLITRAVEAIEDFGPANPPVPTAVDAARAIEAVFDQYVATGGPTDILPADLPAAERSGYLAGLQAAAGIARRVK